MLKYNNDIPLIFTKQVLTFQRYILNYRRNDIISEIYFNIILGGGYG